MARAPLRWYVKKSARLTVALGSSATGSLLARRLLQPRAIRVLTYHRIGHVPHDPFCVEPEVFDEQIRTLAEQRRAVSLEQVQAFVAGKEILPEGACLVTLDDGMLSTLTEALPILRRHAVPAVAYVSTNLIGQHLRGAPERYMTWDEVREVAASNVIAIGSHAHTHRSLGLLAPAEAADEVRRSRQVLQEQLGRAIPSFAYPFGTFADFDAETDRAIGAAGFEIAFTSIHGAIRQGMNPISLPRIKVERGDSPLLFGLLCHGGMDAWAAVDRNLWRLQASRAYPV